MTEMLNEPQELKDSSFESFVSKYPLTVIDCWAEWCMPCKMLSPLIDEMAKEFSGKVAFGKLDVDKNHETAKKYGIMSIPTLLVFKDGKHIDTIVGAMPRQALEPKITKYLE